MDETTTWGILRLTNCNSSIGRGLDNYCHPALVFLFFELSATPSVLLALIELQPQHGAARGPGVQSARFRGPA
jgi:hypothetical protein